MSYIDEFLSDRVGYDYDSAEKLRQAFVERYNEEKILELALEEYCYSGVYDTYCYQIQYGLQALASMGNAFPSVFGVYIDSNRQIKMSKHLDGLFKRDYKRAFDYQKKEIVSLIKAGKSINKTLIERVHINQQFKFKLLSIYYPDLYYPVCTREALDGYCDAFGISHGSGESFLDVNLRLVSWCRANLPDDWNLNTAMGLSDWLWRHGKYYGYDNDNQSESNVAMEHKEEVPRRPGTYRMGDYIYHIKFGKGYVFEADNGRPQTIKVRFDDKPRNITITSDMKDKIRLLLDDEISEIHSTATIPKDLGIVGSSKDGNLAIKCNYCDGGSDSLHIGFSGICSDRMIAHNIDVEKRAWCSHEDCPCFQYHQGKISKNSLRELARRGEFTCYESTMLSDWMTQAGLTDDLRPKRFGSTLHKGAVCVFTTRLPNMDEQDRFVFGLFIIDELYYGDDRRSGYVKCNTDYHVELTPDEAKKIKFWDYYRNKNNPDQEQWGTGLYRFVSNQSILLMLQKIIIMREGDDKEEVIGFLKEFCRQNNLTVPSDVTIEVNNPIVSFSCGDTYDLVMETDVHAHPIKAGYPSKVSRYLMVRAQGGKTDCLYRVTDTVDLNPLDSDLVNDLSDKKIKTYINKRKKSFGFKYAPMPYRFYVMERIHEFEPPFILTPNPQGFKYLSFDEIGVDEKDVKDFKIRKIVSITDEQKEASEELENKEISSLGGILDPEVIDSSFEYIPIPVKRMEVEERGASSPSSAYPRDEKKKINALRRSGFVCECDSEHESFISKRTGKRYLETHHLIPLEYWKSFENSLDVEANIVCLCSNCHNRIHYGIDSDELVSKLYALRKSELEKVGLSIELKQLLKLYNGDYISKE